MSIRKWINRIYVKKYITLCHKDLHYYVDKLNQNTPFSFSRYGDGEWNAILGKPGMNCDGHEFFPEMGKLLKNALLHPLDYIYAIQRAALRGEGRKISLLLKENSINLAWHNSDIFHYANIDGRLFPLIQALRKKKVALIGPSHLKNLDKSCFDYDTFIEVPPKNCFNKIDEIRKNILSYANNKKGIVYSLSASMPANILIHELFPVLGKENWLIDFGSLWDIYVGVKSRGHYSSEGWEDKIKVNLNGK